MNDVESDLGFDHPSLFITMDDTVIFSGYQLDLRSFIEFMNILVRPQTSQEDIDRFVRKYGTWKASLPRKETKRVPVIRWVWSPSSSFIIVFPSHFPGRFEGRTITHLFFPTSYTFGDRLGELDVPIEPDVVTTVPTEEDKAKLTQWMAYVNQNKVGDNSTSGDMFEFVAMKRYESPSYMALVG